MAVAQDGLAMCRRAEPAIGLLDQILDDRAGLCDCPAKAAIGLVIFAAGVLALTIVFRLSRRTRA